MTSCTELKDLRECGKDFFMLKQKKFTDAGLATDCI